MSGSKSQMTKRKRKTAYSIMDFDREYSPNSSREVLDEYEDNRPEPFGIKLAQLIMANIKKELAKLPDFRKGK